MWIGFISGAGSCLRGVFARDCGSDYLILRGWPDHGADVPDQYLCQSYKEYSHREYEQVRVSSGHPLDFGCLCFDAVADSYVEDGASSHL